MKIRARNKGLLSRIQELKGEHPFWGYRRIWAYLRYRMGIVVNKKRIYRLMKEDKLLVKPNRRLKAIRAKYPNRSKPRASKSKSILGYRYAVLITHIGNNPLLWDIQKITRFFTLKHIQA